MRWHLFCIGKPKLPWARGGVDEYLPRLRGKVEVHFLKPRPPREQTRELIQRSEGMLRVLLDETGKELTSLELARQVTDWERQAVKSIALFIGGADGHTDGLQACADWSWSLSRLTLQHELALVVALEQIYRAYSIIEGSSYHRA